MIPNFLKAATLASLMTTER